MDRYLSLPMFQNPVQLLQADDRGQLSIVKETVNQFREITHALNTVVVTGPRSSGKSTLHNTIAGFKAGKGFATGSSLSATTKGLWVYCKPHPVNENEVLVLLDSEGVGDIRKDNREYDTWNFALCTLLGSTLIYNQKGELSQIIIHPLHCVAEMSKCVKVNKKSNGQEMNDYDLFFPTKFVLVLRDFTNVLNIEGKMLSENEYFERCLDLKSDAGDDFNKPRESIRTFFRDRNCFAFDTPARSSLLRTMGEERRFEDSELDPNFVDAKNKFVDYILRCPGLQLENGQPVNGLMFSCLLEAFVESLRNNGIICVKEAHQKMAGIHNKLLLKECVKKYTCSMTRVFNPQPSSEEALRLEHEKNASEAINIVLNGVVYDKDGNYLKQANTSIKKKYRSFQKEYQKLQEEMAREVLRTLSQEMEKNLKKNKYPGGLRKFREDVQEIVSRYSITENLGTMKDYILFEFLAKMWDQESKMKLLCDKDAGDETGKGIEAIKRTVEERQIEEDKIRTHDTQQLLKDENQDFENMLSQLKMKQEEEIRRAIDHHDKIMRARINEQTRLMKEGFEAKADELNKTILRLGQEIESLRRKFEEYEKLLGVRRGIAKKRKQRSARESMTMKKICIQEASGASTVRGKVHGHTPSLMEMSASDCDTAVKISLQTNLSEDSVQDCAVTKQEIIRAIKENNAAELEQILSLSPEDIVKFAYSISVESNNRSAQMAILNYMSSLLMKRYISSHVFVWPGVLSGGKAVLVCYFSGQLPEKFGTFYGMDVLYREYGKVSQEATRATQSQDNKRATQSKYQYQIMQECLKTYGENLFKVHSNLEAIFTSAIRVIGGRVKVEPAIVLYCRIKGVIPFGEPMFPTELTLNDQTIKVDVREGYFCPGPRHSHASPFLPQRSIERNSTLRMGCSIGPCNDMTTSGSIGPFVRIDDNKIGFLTCAHVLGDIKNPSSILNKRVVQPADADWAGKKTLRRLCGIVKEATFNQDWTDQRDGSNITSIDAALVEITDRVPGRGNFTWIGDQQLKDAGFEVSPTFDSGACRSPEFGDCNARVVKCGQATGLRKGTIQPNGAMVKYDTTCLHLPPTHETLQRGMKSNNTWVMKGQFLVESCRLVFFEPGDSGSGVFVVDTENKLTCVGLAIGYMTDFTCVVTPIDKVLTALMGQSNTLARFGNDMDISVE